MADELIRKQTAQLPGTPQMSISASGEATAIGVVNGDVRLEMGPEALTLLQHILGGQQPSPSHAVEWAGLSTERYNVFVIENERYDCGAFCIGRRVALKNMRPEYREYYHPLSDPLITELLDMPCLFAIRNLDFMSMPDHYPAFLGRLTGIQRQGENLRFTFTAFAKFRQQFINDNIDAFGLKCSSVRNQLDEEHWCIIAGNLLQIAMDMGIDIR